METQDEGATVEASIADLRGVAVPPLLDARIASLMWSFAQLTPNGQKRFMELLNDYLYALTRAAPAEREATGRWRWPSLVHVVTSRNRFCCRHAARPDGARFG